MGAIDMRLFLVDRDGAQYGPYSETELREYIVQGNVEQSDLVWTDGMSEWQPASQVLASSPAQIPSDLGIHGSKGRGAAASTSSADLSPAHGSPDRELIRRYFTPFPKWTIFFVASSVIVALKAIDLLMSGHYGVGLSVLACAAGFIALSVHLWLRWKKQPTDQEMDAWLDADIRRLHARALEKSGTDRSELIGVPVTVSGPRAYYTGGERTRWDELLERLAVIPYTGAFGIGFKKGKDNVLRFTPLGVTVINFTEGQLLQYSCVLDLTTGNALSESTDEYFYRDVVSVSTRTKSQTIELQGKGTVQLNTAEVFELTTSGGTSVEVMIRDPKLVQMMGGGEIPTGPAERAIQTVRKMVREKKMAA